MLYNLYITKEKAMKYSKLLKKHLSTAYRVSGPVVSLLILVGATVDIFRGETITGIAFILLSAVTYLIFKGEVKK